MMKLFTTIALLPLAGLLFSTGCNSSSETAVQSDPHAGTAAPAHDPDDVPLTDAEKEALQQGIGSYANALLEIKSYRNTIRDGVNAGDPAKAHRPLDELDVVLEYLPTVARDSNVPRTQWETVNTSAQQLRDLFNQVHTQIDAGEEPDYQAVAAGIDAAIARLDGVSSAGQ